MTLYLHVGAHKTGTTTIQQFSAARRSLLLSRGLYYPDLTEIGRPAAASHHSFAHAVAGRQTRRPFSDSELTAFVEVCAQKSREHNVLLSAEPIFRHLLGDGSFEEGHARYVERLGEWLRPVPEIVPVVALRRQDTFAASMVQEQIKTTTMTRSLAEFASVNAQFMDYDAHVRLYQRVFGRPVVLIYEQLIRGDGLLRNFFGALGVPLSAREADFKPTNQSLHPAVILYKLRLNREGELRPGIRQAILARVSREMFGSERRSLFTEDELDRLFASFEVSNAALAQRLGMPSPLFPEREPLAPRYSELPDADFHRIDARVAELVAERKGKRLVKRPRKAARRPLLRRLLRKLGLDRGIR